MPPGYPIMLLKSNELNMAAVSDGNCAIFKKVTIILIILILILIILIIIIIIFAYSIIKGYGGGCVF